MVRWTYEEGNFELSTDPETKIKFEGTFTNPVERTIKVTNRSDNRQVFKIKCTDNKLLRIRTPVGALDTDESAEVVLTLRPQQGAVPAPDKHYVGVYHIPGPEGATPRSVWQEHNGPPLGTRRITIEFRKTEND